jgi:hypothetical protein
VGPVRRLAVCWCIALCGCQGDERLEFAARALADPADKCLIDTREHRIKYDLSYNCTALSALSMQYIEAGAGSAWTRQWNMS